MSFPFGKVDDVCVITKSSRFGAVRLGYIFKAGILADLNVIVHIFQAYHL